MSRSTNRRFVPSLESLGDRINLSTVVPSARFTIPTPPPVPVVTIEYLVLGVVPSQGFTGGVYVGGGNFTNNRDAGAADAIVRNTTFTGGVRVASADVGGDNGGTAVGATDSITTGTNTTAIGLLLPAVQKVREAASRAR